MQDISSIDEEWIREARKEARREGEILGELIGHIQGEAWGEMSGGRRIIHRQLEKKFGPLSTQMFDKINNASIDTLEAMGETLLMATRVDEVLMVEESS